LNVPPELLEAIDRLRWGAERSDGLSVDLKPQHCAALYDAMAEMVAHPLVTATLPTSVDVGSRIVFEGREYEAVSFEARPRFENLETAGSLTVIVERR
jgi:hypothetical protein